MKIIIVGQGIAGSWLAQTAIDEGHEVVVISGKEPSAERAALAMLRPSYYSREHRPLIQESLALWGETNEVLRGADVNRWDREELRHQKDWFAVDPKPLVLRGEYTQITGWAIPRDNRSVAIEDEGPPFRVETADRVVWCTGSAPGGGPGDGKYSYGVTWVQDGVDSSFLPPYLVRHLAPYKTLVRVRFQDGIRLGTSSANTLEKAREQGNNFFAIACNLGWADPGEIWYPVEGRRFHRENWYQEGFRGASWAGFHRSGFGVVPALAKRVLEQVVNHGGE